MESVQLITADGHRLAADLDHPIGAPIAAAVVCHPHPRYGGNRHNPVIEALFEALPASAITALRFDFRAVHDHGNGELLDVAAALDAVERAVPPDTPLVLVGYSFGAVMALRTDDRRVVACAAVAPPLGRMGVLQPTRPTLVLIPRHDQYCPPEVAAPILADWPVTQLEVIETADHFLVGHTRHVARAVTAWLIETVAGSPSDPSSA